MTANGKKLLQIFLIVLFFLLISLYAVFRSHDLVQGVKITKVNLTDGMVVASNIQKVTGNAKNATHLALNGREISIDEDGNFNETIALLSGYNIINIKAKDRFGYVDEKNYRLIYQKQ